MNDNDEYIIFNYQVDGLIERLLQLATRLWIRIWNVGLEKRLSEISTTYVSHISHNSRTTPTNTSQQLKSLSAKPNSNLFKLTTNINTPTSQPRGCIRESDLFGILTISCENYCPPPPTPPTTTKTLLRGASGAGGTRLLGHEQERRLRCACWAAHRRTSAGTTSWRRPSWPCGCGPRGRAAPGDRQNARKWRLVARVEYKIWKLYCWIITKVGDSGENQFLEI